MHQDEELHEKLMLAFREYFKSNQKWMEKGTRRAGMDTRFWLNEIRHLCDDRRKSIMDWRYALNDITEAKKAQKREGGDKTDTNQYMSWTYQNTIVETLPEDCVGFVYLITNSISGRKYIGKKLAKFSKTSVKTVTLKNGTKKKKKIRSKVDSDWREYYGSSPNLQKDIDTLGKENFTREILYYCNSKAQCSYIEAREQFSRKVLESDDYYNGHIQVRVHGSHIILKS